MCLKGMLRTITMQGLIIAAFIAAETDFKATADVKLRLSLEREM